MPLFISVVLITFVGAALAAGQTVPGLATGQRIPAFSLADQNGQQQTFQTIRGSKGALLVFYRSADW